MAEDLIAAPWLNLTAEEKRVFGQLFRQADSESIGVVTGEAAVKLFEKTRLDPRVLGEIWQIADKENRGLLTPSGFSVVLRLIGHYQAGRDPMPELALRHGPLPRFENANIPSLSPKVEPPLGPSPNALESQVTGPGPIRLPPLTPDKSAQYAALFDKSGAHGGILPGEQAKQIFERAGLSNEVLGKIWSLADTEQKGALGITEFVIAMHLLASFKTGQIRTLPNSLPFALYDAASRQTTNRSVSGPTTISPVPKQFTGSSASRATYSSKSQLLPQVTGSSSSWLVTPADQSKFDAIFKNLDKSNRGYITGDEAVPFFIESKLPDDVLAQIWDLADINSAGRLSRDEFAVAMYLIRQQRGKLDGRESLPPTLPANLVPPSMREQRRNISVETPPNFESSAPVLRSAAEDLFGLDALSLPTTTTEKTPTRSQRHLSTHPTQNLYPAGANQIPPLPLFQPSQTKAFIPSSSFGQSLTNQITGSSNISTSIAKDLHGVASSEDLLGDNDPEISKKLTGETAEVANLSNQVNNLSTQLKEVQDQKASYQNELIQSSTQKRELEARLAQLRTLYNNELNDVRSLQERHALTLSETKKVQVEVETLEISLQDLNNEHSRVFDALQADQLENSRLKERIRKVNSEIALLKPALEKATSSARQQKGMVEINKKLLLTTETERDTIKNELEDLNKSTKEHCETSNTISKSYASTPASNLTTATSSTNPFFRRKENSSDKIIPPTDTFSENRQPEGLSNNAFESSFESSPLNEASKSNPENPVTRSISVASINTIPVQAKSTDLNDIRVMSTKSPELVASQVLSKPPELPILSSEARKISSSQSFPTKLHSGSSSREAFAPSHGSDGNFLRIDASNNLITDSKSLDPIGSSTGNPELNNFHQNLNTSKPAPATTSKFLSNELQSSVFNIPAGENSTNETTASDSFIFHSPERLGSAKDDFDSAFAGFSNTAKSQERINTGGSSESGSAGGANIVESHKEFPPITELSDDSDSTSEGVGFDDDFATACPGSVGDKSMTIDAPVELKSTSIEILSDTDALKSLPTATQKLSSPPTNSAEVSRNDLAGLDSQYPEKNHSVSETTAADSTVLLTNSTLPAQIPTKDLLNSIQTESSKSTSDDDFDNLEDAKEGDENDEVAKGSVNSQPSLDEFNSIFDSTIWSKGHT